MCCPRYSSDVTRYATVVSHYSNTRPQYLTNLGSKHQQQFHLSCPRVPTEQVTKCTSLHKGQQTDWPLVKATGMTSRESKSCEIMRFVCNQVAKSGDNLMFVCLQKDTKQRCDATKHECIPSTQQQAKQVKSQFAATQHCLASFRRQN